MTNKIIKLFLTIIVFQFSSIALAQYGSVPEIAMGARSSAMGQIATLSFSDAVGVSMNPANICRTDKYSTSLFYSDMFGNAHVFSFGFVFPISEFGNLGISNYRYTFKGIQARDVSGNIVDETDFSRNHFLLTFGRNISENIHFGVNAKLVSQMAGPYFSDPQNIGFDLGLQYSVASNHFLFKDISFGISVDNIVKPLVKYNNEREYSLGEYSPREYRFIAEKGVTFENSAFTFILNYVLFEEKAYAPYELWHFGLEYIYRYFMFWGGVSDDDLSFGFGINISSFNISYGLTKYEPRFNPRNMFSVSYAF